MGIAIPQVVTEDKAGGAQVIDGGLRFDSSKSHYLTRTPGSAGNRKTWTWSGWVKRSTLGTSQYLWFVQFGTTDSERFIVFFDTDNTLQIHVYTQILRATSMVFRDASSWYHITLTCDTTQGTANDRLKLYVNGSQVTTFSTTNNLSQNTDTAVNSTNIHVIGRNQSLANQYFDGYLADIHFIDGQALTPSSFAETDATTGAWNPKAYTGSYGTNGFHLDFADNSAATAAALGKDTSGNSNNWTPNNLSVTAGAGNDSTVDSPTNYGTDTGAGNEVRGNYATLNPLDQRVTDNGTISNGNLDYAQSSTGSRQARATIGVSSGKWYWEFTHLGGNASHGISQVTSSLGSFPGTSGDNDGISWFVGGNIYRNGSTGTYSGLTYAVNDVIGVALNLDAGTLVFYKNGVSQGTAATGLSGTWFPAFGTSSVYVVSFTANFGQRAFAYTAPSGFKALCTANLPTPTIAKGSDYFDVKLYTGNGSTQTISGLNFSPDFLWLKSRSLAESHLLMDTVRGTGTYGLKKLFSNTTWHEDEYYADSTREVNVATGGFALSGGGAHTNQNSQTYVAWAWDAGANSSKTYTVTVVSDKFHIDGKQQPTLNLEEGSTYTFDLSAASNSGHPFRLSESANGPTQYTTGVTTSGTAGNAGATLTIAVASGAPTLYYFCTNHSGMGGQINTNTTAGASNFAGSITSTVRANASAGFSICSWTAPSSGNFTWGHGLGVEPYMVIVKTRASAGLNWRVYHKSIIATVYENIDLSTTGAKFTSGTNMWGAALPTSTVVGSTANNTVGANDASIAYCFAPVAGYSSFGSYTGNGSSDGPFVYTGFRVKWLMLKNASSAGTDWFILDAARNTYNVTTQILYPNLSSSELSITGLDFLSNGFKWRDNGSAQNGNGNTIIYAAFAESPFSYSRAR